MISAQACKAVESVPYKNLLPAALSFAHRATVTPSQVPTAVLPTCPRQSACGVSPCTIVGGMGVSPWEMPLTCGQELHFKVASLGGALLLSVYEEDWVCQACTALQREKC